MLNDHNLSMQNVHIHVYQKLLFDRTFDVFLKGHSIVHNVIGTYIFVLIVLYTVHTFTAVT